MNRAPAALYFDFVDPVSYLVDLELEAAEEKIGIRLERRGFELRPPPGPLTDTSDAFWASRWAEAEEVATLHGLPLARPSLVPWSRKAHELHLLADSLDVGPVVRRSIFAAFFEHRRDIGRVDVLIEVAQEAGLDPTETKAALDVDRLEPDLAAARRGAIEAGVRDAPTIIGDTFRLEGFHNRIGLSTLLARE